MSHDVPLDELAVAMADYDFAYLLTSPSHGAPHAVAVRPRLEGDHLVVDGLGRRSPRNASETPTVSLVWPPRSIEAYSLIVDGLAVVEPPVHDTGDGRGASMRITPTRAVLHRPAPGTATDPAACVSDCIEIPLDHTSAG